MYALMGAHFRAAHVFEGVFKSSDGVEASVEDRLLQGYAWALAGHFTSAVEGELPADLTQRGFFKAFNAMSLHREGGELRVLPRVSDAFEEMLVLEYVMKSRIREAVLLRGDWREMSKREVPELSYPDRQLTLLMDLIGAWIGASRSEVACYLGPDDLGWALRMDAGKLWRIEGDHPLAALLREHRPVKVGSPLQWGRRR